MKWGGFGLAALFAVTACTSSGSKATNDGGAMAVAAPGKQVIGPSGGTLASADGRLTLQVAPNTLASDVTFTITPAVDTPPGAIGTAYDIGPEGTTFDTPVEIDLNWDPVAATAAGVATADGVQISTFVDGAWQPQATNIVDPTAHRVVTLTTHLSKWAITPGRVAAKTCACTGTLATAARDCCKGLGADMTIVGAQCSCVAPLDALAACITKKTGGLNGPNYCVTKKLIACCTGLGATPNDACDCVGNESNLRAIAACTVAAFQPAKAPEWALCAAGLDPAGDAGPPPQDSGPPPGTDAGDAGADAGCDVARTCGGGGGGCSCTQLCTGGPKYTLGCNTSPQYGGDGMCNCELNNSDAGNVFADCAIAGQREAAWTACGFPAP